MQFLYAEHYIFVYYGLLYSLNKTSIILYYDWILVILKFPVK